MRGSRAERMRELINSSAEESSEVIDRSGLDRSGGRMDEEDEELIDQVPSKTSRFLEERTHDLSGISEKSEEESRHDASMKKYQSTTHLNEKDSSEYRPSTIDSRDLASNTTPGTEGELDKLRKYCGNNENPDLSSNFFSPVEMPEKKMIDPHRSTFGTKTFTQSSEPFNIRESVLQTGNGRTEDFSLKAID